jgi:CRP/FNR family cyclic AMP-dependent transcriptional regulator
MRLDRHQASVELDKSPLFASLDKAAADALRSAMTDVEYERGSIVFREGDEGDSLFVIADGRLKVSRSSWDGREKVVAVLGPGDLVGELSVLDGGPRTMTTTAIGDVVLLRLGAESLNSLLARQHGVAQQLLRALASRLRFTNDSMADLIFLDVTGRIARALIDLGDRFGHDSPNGLVIHHEMSQAELADLAGTSRETVSRVLGTFARRRWLTYEVGQVCILDMNALRHRAGQRD